MINNEYKVDYTISNNRNPPSLAVHCRQSLIIHEASQKVTVRNDVTEKNLLEISRRSHELGKNCFWNRFESIVRWSKKGEWAAYHFF